MGTTINGSNDMQDSIPSDEELASIAALLRVTSEGSDDDRADENVCDTLAQLETAHVVASQMESDLDRLLERLDEMVEGLETSQPAGETALASVISDEAGETPAIHETNDKSNDVSKE